MREREDRSILTEMLLTIIGIIFFLMLSIVGVKEYVNYSINKNIVKHENDQVNVLPSLIKDENISKVFDNRKETIAIKKTKDKACESIITIYNSLFKDYMEQLKYCKKEEKRYEKERIQKQFDKRVIVQQNKTLLTCYETLKLTEEGLESAGKSLDGNYSQKISKEIMSMSKIFSQNKKMIESKLVKFRTKINEK